jgi:hypothetical protein
LLARLDGSEPRPDRPAERDAEALRGIVPLSIIIENIKMTTFRPYCGACESFVTCVGRAKLGGVFPCADCETYTELREVR